MPMACDKSFSRAVFHIAADDRHGDRYEYIDVPETVTCNTPIKVHCTYCGAVFSKSARELIMGKQIHTCKES